MPSITARTKTVLRRTLVAGAAAAGAAVVAVVAGFAVLWSTTPDPAQIAERTTAAPSRIVSADGMLLDTIGSRVQQPVSIGQVSPHIVQALLATEDRRFYDHAGVDLRRTLAALWHTAHGSTQGGSTLTQQLARNVFPQAVGNDRSLLRKAREMVVALKIERACSKQDILLMYLNQVPFLYNVTGIEMAAQTYFGSSAADVSPHQAALLVAMLKGPAWYDPQRAPERALKRRDMVLALMAKNAPGTAPAFDVAAEQARPLGLQLQRRDLEPQNAPHFVQQVRRELADWAAAHGVELARAGLTIHTTLDTRLQALAEQAVQRQGEVLQASAARAWAAGPSSAAFAALWQERPELLAELLRQTPAHAQARARGADDAEALRAGLADRRALAQLQRDKTRLEAGFVALDPQTGAVLAYVGSRDYATDRYDHAGVAQRQPGSTFKPFVYGAALQGGIPETRKYSDDPVALQLADGSSWRPRDAGGATGQVYTLRSGLAQSRNTVTAQVMQQIGVASVVRFARDMGIEHARLDPVPSLALGTSPVSLLEMVHAYGTLAALGVKRQPLLVSSIDDRRGAELARFGSKPQRVLDEEPAALLVDLLRDAVDRGTGTLLRTRFGIKGDVAGKTGTTQNNADGWFIAMRPGIVVGAWVGFNDQRITLRGGNWGNGGRSALLIVGDFMQNADAAGVVDAAARFPSPPRPPAPLPADDAAADADAPLSTDSDAPADATSALVTVAWTGGDAAPQAQGAQAAPAAAAVPALPLSTAEPAVRDGL